jgi:hypothetical protein
MLNITNAKENKHYINPARKTVVDYSYIVYLFIYTITCHERTTKVQGYNDRKRCNYDLIRVVNPPYPIVQKKRTNAFERRPLEAFF